MKLRFLGGRHQGRIVDLIPAGFSIGRGKGNDLVLDEEGISRHHCKIHEVAGKWVVEDLESTNGVRVNGQRIDGAQSLTSGDRVAIHRELLLFTDGSDIVDTGDLAKAAHRLSEIPDGEPVSPPPSPPPSAVTEIDEMPKPFEPSAPLPWARIVLLLALLVFIAWALHSLRTPVDADQETDDSSVTSEVVDDQGEAPQEGTDSALGDDELAALMANDDDGPDTLTGTETAPVPAPTPLPDVPAPGGVGGVDVLPGPDAQAPAEGGIAPPEQAPSVARAAETGQAVAVVLVVSEPSGATISIDGDERGTTPLVVRDLSEGRHRVELSLAGYDSLTRQIHVPDLLPDKPYVLRLRAGMLQVTSSPAGATVWHGSQVLGNAPLLIDWLGDGDHVLKFSMPGYEAAEKKVEVSRVGGEVVHVKLTPLFGSIEVVTRPAGCQVFVDGTFKAVTGPSNDKPGQSASLVFGGMAERAHVVRVEHLCGSVAQRRIRVVRGEVARVAVKLWVLDTKLTLDDGSVKYGMLMSRNEHGDIILATSASEKDWQRYFGKQVVEVEVLSAEQAKELLAVRRDKADTPVAGDEEKAPGAPAVEDREPDEPEPAQKPVRPPGANAGDDEPVGKQELRFAAKALGAMFKQTSATELNRRLKGHILVINGVPTAQGPDALGGSLMFGSRVRCFIRQDVYDQFKEQIRMAHEAETPITVRGVAAGIQGGRLVVRDCHVVGKEGGGK